LIEALPPILIQDETAELLAYYPEYEKEQRSIPAHPRLHFIQNVLQFFAPLPIHFDLEQRSDSRALSEWDIRHEIQQ
jgi:hypothetical protein